MNSTETIQQPRDKSSARLELFDAMRFFAAVAIIWQHNNESPTLNIASHRSAFAVPFFTASAVFLVFQSLHRNPARPTGQYIVGRFQRIYIPFIVWSVIYFVFRNAKHLLLSHAASVTIEPQFFLAGTAHHLWFLPFIFLVSVVSFLVAKGVWSFANEDARTLFILLTATGGIAIGLSPNTLFIHQFIINRSWSMLPSIFFAMSLGTAFPRIPARVWASRSMLAVGIVMLAGGTAIVDTRWQSMLTDNLAGVGAVLIGLVIWPRPLPRIIKAMAELGVLAYGIYLVHVLFIEGLQAIAAHFGYSGRWQLDLATFILAVVGSILLSKLIVKSRWLRWMIPT